MTWTDVDSFRLAIVSLADQKPPEENLPLPAVYLFGNTPSNENEIIIMGAIFYRMKLAETICLCGGGHYAPHGILAYSGGEKWKHILIDELGVPENKVICIPRPRGISHTGTEAERLILLAQAEQWKDIFIVAAPHHMPRAFAATATQALRLYPNLRIWCRPAQTSSWTKPAVFSQGTIEGERMNVGVDAEHSRLTTKHGNELDIGEPEAIFDYIRQRNAKAGS